MANLSITLTGQDELDRLSRFITPQLLSKAIKGGVAYASRSVPPAVSKGIRESYNIPAARVKQDISRVSFTDDGNTATIRFSRRPPTLTQFAARAGTRGTGQRGRGRGKGWTAPSRPGRPITAMVLRSDGRKPVQGAFVVTGNSGNRIVLRRSKSTPGKLYSVYGPSIGSIFLRRSAIATQLQADVQRRISEQFQRGFERSLGAAARGFG